jgi:hypothetical protein
MRSPVYRPQWMIVLTSVVLAGMSVASGETFPAFFAEPHPSSCRLDAHLRFPGNQQQLLEAVAAVGKQIVLIVFSGRPLILNWAANHWQ